MIIDLMKIICKGKRFSIAKDDITTIICHLSLIPKTCMYFFLFISHVLFPHVGTEWTHVWFVLITNVIGMLYVLTRRARSCKPFLSLICVVWGSFVVVVVVDMYD